MRSLIGSLARIVAVCALLVVIAAGLISVLEPTPAYAMWWKNVGGIASSIARGVADTSETIVTAACKDLHMQLFCDADSAKLILQVSNDGGTRWCTLLTEQVNGTDETYALQVNKVLSALGTGGTTYLPLPPGSRIRFIVNNDDAAVSEADTMENITLRIGCNR